MSACLPLSSARTMQPGLDASCTDAALDVDSAKRADGVSSSQGGENSGGVPFAHRGEGAQLDPCSQGGRGTPNGGSSGQSDGSRDSEVRAALLRSRLARSSGARDLGHFCSDEVWKEVKATEPHITKEVHDNGFKRRRAVKRAEKKSQATASKDAVIAQRHAELVACPKGKARNEARPRHIDMDDL